MNIDPYGWTIDGSKRTLYSAQASKLISLASLAVSTSTCLPCLPFNTTKWGNFFQPLSSTDTEEGSWVSDSEDAVPVGEMKGECELLQPRPLEIDQSNYLSRKIDSRDDVPLNGDNLLVEAHSDVKMVEQDEKGIILMKLKELAFCCGCQDVPLTDYLIQGVEELKEIQTEQNLKMRYLEQKLVMLCHSSDVELCYFQ
ncbi:hypothetical protein Patl1_31445 [Pistacia atlantica]|uniref:Uncharacterized protein n=1 Tax=Pistacia atlantica TaxID=434234 RepID=A0ACC1ARA8_9ROSI|nr:hypothetical protein Patl1_31445 [Pistacia atlantica]